MLYPRQRKIPYYKNVVKIVAVLLVLALATNIALLPMLLRLDYPIDLIIEIFFNTVTYVIPPFLIIFVTLCISLSLTRLRRKDIYGMDPDKTIAAGYIQHICFDKTGTLTESRLDILGIC